MPLHDFECEACGKVFESIFKASEPETGHCPHCGSAKTAKLLSQFKVGGRGDLRESTDHGCHGPVFEPDPSKKKPKKLGTHE